MVGVSSPSAAEIKSELMRNFENCTSIISKGNHSQEAYQKAAITHRHHQSAPAAMGLTVSPIQPFFLIVPEHAARRSSIARLPAPDKRSVISVAIVARRHHLPCRRSGVEPTIAKSTGIRRPRREAASSTSVMMRRQSGGEGNFSTI